MSWDLAERPLHVGPASDQDSVPHLSPVLAGWLQGLTC